MGVSTPRQTLDAALRAVAGTDPLLAPSSRAGFDYQANFAMRLAKQRGENPRGLAEQALAALGDADGLLARGEVAGPGFLNLELAAAPLARWATGALADERLGVAPAEPPEVVAIDYSSPNVAKEMHVGHLRSTVIGDALARTLEFLGHTVIRQNHLGDWGTQFGMLVQEMVETGREDVTDFAELGELYRAAKVHYDADAGFAARARERVVALQAHDPHTLALWQVLVDVSVEHMDEAYAALGVTLEDSDIKGESFYNDALAPTVNALQDASVATENDGALIVASERMKGKDGDPAVLVVRKSDGGFGYPATDFAALRHRVEDLRADRLVYVTDARQAGHFAIVFEVAERAGWLVGARAEHVPFGTVLGEDGRPFRTREGATVALADLLDEAVARARTVVDAKSPELPAEERAAVARAVGIGAVKYADLSSGRQKDYVFSFDRMLALEGNTAPYLQYACVRAESIVGKGGASDAITELSAPAERALVVSLAALSDALAEVAARLEPHRLCTYLFELASAYTAFYDACPVLKADTDAQRASRLALCGLTARTLRTGLGLLGIAVPARM